MHSLLWQANQGNTLTQASCSCSRYGFVPKLPLPAGNLSVHITLIFSLPEEVLRDIGLEKAPFPAKADAQCAARIWPCVCLFFLAAWKDSWCIGWLAGWLAG